MDGFDPLSENHVRISAQGIRMGPIAQRHVSVYTRAD